MSEGPTAVRSSFSASVRARGEDYYYDGRVRLEELDDQGLSGTIRGSRTYRVAIRCDGERLRAWCDCPYVADSAEPCKHLWAALITADAAEALGATLDHHERVELVLDAQVTAAAADDDGEWLGGDDENSESESCGDYEGEGEGEGEDVGAWFLDEDDDDDDDDEEWLDDGGGRGGGWRLAHSMKARLAALMVEHDVWGGSPGRGARPGRRPGRAGENASWREVVATVATPRCAGAPRVSRDLELAAFIDLQVLRVAGVLTVHLGMRRCAAAGPGPLEPIGTRTDPDRFRDPVDRWLLELDPDLVLDTGGIVLGPHGASVVLHKLCESGRLRVLDSAVPGMESLWNAFLGGLRPGRQTQRGQRRARKGRGGRGGRERGAEGMREIDYAPLLDLPALAWDGEAPWSVVLRLEPPGTPGAGADARARAGAGARGRARTKQRVCAVRAALVRGEERIDALDPRLIHPYGLVFFHDRVGLVELGSEGSDGIAWAWLFHLRTSEGVNVPEAEVHELVHSCLDESDGLALELPPELAYEEVRVVPARAVELRAPGPRGIEGTAFADYAGHRVPLGAPGARRVDAEARRIVVRDPAAEQQALAELADVGFRGSALERTDVSAHEAGAVCIGQKRLPGAVLALMKTDWTITGEGVRYRAASAATARVVSGIDWFELQGTVSFGDVELSLPELLRALRKNRGSPSVVLGDGSIGVVPEEWLARWGVLAEATPGASGEPARFGRAQIGLVDACLALVPDGAAEVDAAFSRLRDELASFDGIAPAKAPRGFTGELRPYQQTGLGWMRFLDRLGFGGCLADDMGLGKTVQVLALLQSDRGGKQRGGEQRQRPSLVVVPRSLVFNWVEEARRFAPKLRVHTHFGVGRSAEDGFAGQDLVITTYGTLRRDVGVLGKIEFERVILDEAQMIKNAGSATAKAARCLRARQRLALSGTPIENHLGEIVSLFDFLNPGMFAGLGRLQKAAGGRVPDADARELLRRAVRPFILRRTKSDVAPELPERTEQTLVVELDPDHRALYDELLGHFRTSVRAKVAELGTQQTNTHVLEALLRLRQAACHPGLLDAARRRESSAKLDLLLDKLSEVVDEGHKALVFSQFTSLLDIVRTRLRDAKIDHEYLDGQTRDRKARVDRFQSQDGPSVFLLSLKAGGVGLNLTAADYVFILDPWWNPAAEAQAIDRTHRIGQTRRIMAYRLLSANTVEERVAELQERKRELVSAIIGDGGDLAGRLTREDLDLLLGLNEPAAATARRGHGRREAAREAEA